jgi:hypothetical protein
MCYNFYNKPLFHKFYDIETIMVIFPFSMHEFLWPLVEICVCVCV